MSQNKERVQSTFMLTTSTLRGDGCYDKVNICGWIFRCLMNILKDE
jgi:hypothetical protein